MNQSIELFFKKYDLYFRSTKIEDSKVYDEALQKFLHRKKLAPCMLFYDANSILKDVLGFTYTDIDCIVTNMENRIRLFNAIKKCLYWHHHVIISKRDLHYLFDDIEAANLECLINFLSLDNCVHCNSLASNRMLELRCIKENEEILSFGLCNLRECLLILKVVSISGHYCKEIGIDAEKNKLFVGYQQRLSTYFSYVVGDFLQHYGFILPLNEKGLIKVELKTIQLPNKKLTFNDIDVLALDPINKRLYNCELKYYRVKIDYQSMMTDALEMKKFENLQKRQALLEENKEAILNEVFGVYNVSEYSFHPIVVTSRVNNNTKRVAEYSFEELKHKVINGEIL